jgi:3-hydroxyacyl-[acyl-carrier-protein] dehydratase
MVLVDRVVAMRPGFCIEVDKAVSGSEPCFSNLAESLPADRYAYPRSLIIESFGQSAALLWLGTVRETVAIQGIPMVGRLRGCTFDGNVFPGDVIRHTVQIDTVVDNNAIMTGYSRVGDRTILRVRSLVAVARPLDTVKATR